MSVCLCLFFGHGGKRTECAFGYLLDDQQCVWLLLACATIHYTVAVISCILPFMTTVIGHTGFRELIMAIGTAVYQVSYGYGERGAGGNGDREGCAS